MTRYHARWVCPVSSPPIPNGTVIEHQGRIAFVGPESTAPQYDDDVVDLGDVILMPGLVNAHCHLELTAMRGFLDGLGFRDWILRLAMARRAVMDAAMMLDAARLGIEEGLRYGVTTFADTGDSGTGFDAMLEYGVRGICYREVFGPDPRQCDEAVRDLEVKLLEMHGRRTRLVRVGVSPHAPYTVSDQLFTATARLAQKHQVPVAVHIAESQLESDLVAHGRGAFADGLRKRGISAETRARSPIALLAQTGVLDREPLLIHCVRADEEDLEAIASHDCGVAHCPASNAKLGHGIAPLTALIASGARVGLGSDSMGGNDQMSLVAEARLAALFASAREHQANAISARQALELLTLGGARALRLENEIGSLDVGKSADLSAFPLSPARAPAHEPVAALIYALAGSPASFVAVAGEVKVRESMLLKSDPTLPARVQRTADRLQGWKRSDEGQRWP